ncbi:hypothetical protein CN128_28190 [Sinorhizobium meliloti]|nr:hypothetical protein SinmeB_1899 [Sinorhizobium meliloti BL225C]AIM00023.1 hypothetical protein DU99_11695 [Sinorhizobium meliloti]ARS71654.1 hypothetical protein SMRU11_32585 [Sinorhizobium meliloti RU11/001]PII38534.1 hypothetical protein T190_19145 [Sinorhizobium meliloti CCBAU 01290]CCM67943.1 hypothetical protein BN406_01898 [Sinorhizobium meliloti Rm41]
MKPAQRGPCTVHISQGGDARRGNLSKHPFILGLDPVVILGLDPVVILGLDPRIHTQGVPARALSTAR